MLMNMIIERTKTTPAVTTHVEDGILEIDGEFYNEDAVTFFDQVIQWYRAFITEEKRFLSVHLRLSYFNTSASKCVMDLLDQLQSYHYTSGGAVEVYWHYHEDDEDSLEQGKEMAEGMDMKIMFLPYS
jgi:hypothetical protein